MQHLYEFDSYRADFERRLLLRGEEVVQLPAKALDTLFVLIQRRGEVVSKDELMKLLWPDSFVEEGNLSQNIHILRKALGESVGEHRYIVTVPGRGYRFVAKVTERSGTASEIVHRATGSASSETPPIPDKDDLWLRKNWLIASLIMLAALGLCLFLTRPIIARFYNNRGVQFQQNGQLKMAIEAYEQALSLNPGYAAAHYNLADAYEEIPDYDRALQEYGKAIDADLTFYPAYNNLSRLYILQRRDYGAALRLLDRAVSLTPKEPSVRYSLYKNYGWATLELHQLRQAEQNLKSAEALDPGRGAAHCLLAKVLDAQGRPKDAVAEWESCAADSNQPEVEPEWRNDAQERLRRESAQ
jgi:DNA-binding winged helix-turn-helix (wHTH) protein/Tfp pilus assembly protein PilF